MFWRKYLSRDSLSMWFYFFLILLLHWALDHYCVVKITFFAVFYLSSYINCLVIKTFGKYIGIFISLNNSLAIYLSNELTCYSLLPSTPKQMALSNMSGIRGIKKIRRSVPTLVSNPLHIRIPVIKYRINITKLLLVYY